MIAVNTYSKKQPAISFAYDLQFRQPLQQSAEPTACGEVEHVHVHISFVHMHWPLATPIYKRRYSAEAVSNIERVF